MTAASINRDREPANTDTIERWEKRHFVLIAITLPVLFGAMFSAMFFGLSNMN